MVRSLDTSKLKDVRGDEDLIPLGINVDWGLHGEGEGYFFAVLADKSLVFP